MKKITALLLVCAMLIALPLFSACNKLDTELAIRVWTLNGTTGFGMAHLMDKDSKNEAALNYEFKVETDASLVSAALMSGEADIGAIPTNLAANLATKKPDDFVLLALNTRGVLYLVVNTAKVEKPASLADLSGKTIYCPAQNPSAITNTLLKKAGVENYTLESTTYAQPAALQAAVAAGEVDYAVLPEPLLTVAKASAAEGVTLETALDLTAEWDKHFTEGSLVQGCVVARKAFVEENPEEVEKFLEEYKASVEFVANKDNAAAAAEMIVNAKIFAKAPVAQKALPNCNLCFVTGAEMKTAMSTFLTALGIALPADSFYYAA